MKSRGHTTFFPAFMTAVIVSHPAMREPNASSRTRAGLKGHIEIGNSSRHRARVAGCALG
jgi:hypothetical protein